MNPASPLPLHLGNLHAYETALLALLAFGPFVVLAFVVVMMRRRDAAVGRGGGDLDGGDTAREDELGRGR